MDREQIHSLCVGWRNLPMLPVGWRNLPTLPVGWRNFFSSCAVVLCQFLVLVGNAGTRCLVGVQSLLRPEKKVLVVCLAGARSWKKKSSSRLFGGCVWPEKKVLVVCLAGAQYYDRKKKVLGCLAGARLLLFLPWVRFTRNHLIFTRNWMYRIWM